MQELPEPYGDFGLQGLHDRLMRAFRHHGTVDAINIDSIVSAMTLIMFGHHHKLRAQVLDAAQAVIDDFRPDMSDEDLVATFKAFLPEMYAAEPVRERFFAARYYRSLPTPAHLAVLAPLLAQYEAATDVQVYAGLTDLQRANSDHLAAAAAASFMEAVLQTPPLAELIRSGG